jgi:hypothetical protein
MQREDGTAEIATMVDGEDAQDSKAVWAEEINGSRMPGQRGTRCRRRLDGGGQDAADGGTRSASASKQESHGIGGVQLVTQWTRFKRTRSTGGATKSTAAEELAPVLGEYAKITLPPLMATSSSAISRPLYFETKQPFA